MEQFCNYQFIMMCVSTRAILTRASHKEPIFASNFDQLYLKNYFELLKSIKIIL